MRKAILVLFEDHNGQTGAYKNLIQEYLILHNAAKPKTFELDLDDPEQVQFYLGRMVKFASGQLDDNPPKLVPIENMQVEKTFKRALVEEGKKLWKEVMYGTKKAQEMEKPGKEASTIPE